MDVDVSIYLFIKRKSQMEQGLRYQRILMSGKLSQKHGGVQFVQLPQSPLQSYMLSERRPKTISA